MRLAIRLSAILALSQQATAFFPFQRQSSIGHKLSYSKKHFNKERLVEVAGAQLFAKQQNNYDIVIASNPSQTNSAGVSSDAAGELYFVAVKIGTSEKVYHLLIDTGATHSWLMGSSCESEACSLHNTLGPDDSSSLTVSWLMNCIIKKIY